jgi:hypothetical protein
VDRSQGAHSQDFYWWTEVNQQFFFGGGDEKDIGPLYVLLWMVRISMMDRGQTKSIGGGEAKVKPLRGR